MMGPRQVDQAALFYEFSLGRHVPAPTAEGDRRVVDLSDVRSHLAPFYGSTCEEVYLNLAYRWICRLGLGGEVPDHSTFSKNRHGRFRDCDLLRKPFKTVVRLHGRRVDRRGRFCGRCQPDCR
jgi:Transposase domain (DUF772)